MKITIIKEILVVSFVGTDLFDRLGWSDGDQITLSEWIKTAVMREVRVLF